MDGLCGLYSLLNFCHHKKLFVGEVRQDPEWYVFEAVEMEGLLTSYYLTRGFEVQHLHTIFARLCRNLRLSFSPYYLDELYAQRGDHFGALKRAISNGGAVVGGFVETKHWMLFYEMKEASVLIYDSAPDGGRKRALVNELTNFSPEGIALMPSSFSLVSNDAQTH